MATKRLPNCRVCGHQKQPRQPCLNCMMVARRESRIAAEEAAIIRQHQERDDRE
jgi:hypothetical protein